MFWRFRGRSAMKGGREEIRSSPYLPNTTMTHTTHTIGVEVEFLGRNSSEGVLSRLRSSSRPSLSRVVDERHTYSTTFHDDRWVMGYDGSVDWEIKSHPLRDTEDIREVYAAIREAGGRVSRSCGTHVHVGIGHFNSAQVARLIRLWLRFEQALDSLQPSSRRASNNHYCQSVYDQVPASLCTWRRASAVQAGQDLTAAFEDLRRLPAIVEWSLHDIARRYQSTRTSKLNLQSFRRYGTVEFRGAAGTLNFRKIDSWISLITALCSMAEQGVEPREACVATFEEMLDEVLPYTVPTLRSSAQNEPRQGSKARQAWDLLDRYRTASEYCLAQADRFVHYCEGIGALAPSPERIFNFEALPETSGEFVRITSLHGEQSRLANWLHIELGLSLGTARNAVSRWAANRGLSARPSHSTNSLRGYLTRRHASLA